MVVCPSVLRPAALLRLGGRAILIGVIENNQLSHQETWRARAFPRAADPEAPALGLAPQQGETVTRRREHAEARIPTRLGGH